MQFRWRTPQMEASLAVRENTPHGRDQSIEFYRLAVELVAPRGERLFAFAGERMCGESDDWNVAGLRIALESPRGLASQDARAWPVAHRAALKRKFRPRCCAKTRAGAPCIMRVVPGKRRCRSK